MMKKYFFKRNIIKLDGFDYTIFSSERRYLYYIEGDRINNCHGADIGSIFNNKNLKKELDLFKIKERISKLNKI